MAEKRAWTNPTGGFQLQWLDTFVRLARTRNQPEVAREIGASQATVSRQVSELERWLNRPLASGASPVRLTDYGEQFAQIAAEMLERLHGARADPSTASPLPPKVSGKNIVI